MQDRYEILDQVGHGGIGRVQRAYDHKMGRHVAIKRILSKSGDAAHLTEATKQMAAEIGALSSLQHPNIVTVFDVGEDDDGPFVVMELLNGKNLDEIVENAPLTWPDFKQVAMQALEALIAAHDLEMIHSDLKPPNIMLTWMPSGSFQVKIVDFGLAQLVHAQTQEDLNNAESVFGSVYFMPPEQFERQPLDARSDLYSLGCCFYQLLAGVRPFDGETIAEVTQAHLDQSVTPIRELRDDVPAWGCDWLMWLINRDREHRPESARDALALFLSHHKAEEKLEVEAAVAARQAAAALAAETASVPAGPSGLFPATGTHAVSVQAGKKKNPRILLWCAIPAAAAALIAVATAGLMKRNEGIRENNAYQSIIANAVQPNVRQVHLNAWQVGLVMDAIANAKPDNDLAGAFEALRKAASSDGADLDSKIAALATDAGLAGEVRVRLLDEVVAHRRAPESVPALLKFARSSAVRAEAMAAFNASLPAMEDGHAQALLDVIDGSRHAELVDAAQQAYGMLIARSPNFKDLAARVANARRNAGSAEANARFDQLLEQSVARERSLAQTQTPPPQQRAVATVHPPTASATPAPAASVQMESFQAADDAGKIAIISELAKTHQASSHSLLRDIAGSADDATLKTHAIRALVELNSHPAMRSDERTMRQRWAQTMWRCDTSEQRILLIDGLAKFREEWSKALLQDLARHRTDNAAAAHARQALADHP